MADILAQVSFPYFSGLPADVSVNTWSFTGADADEATGIQMGAFFEAFYGGVFPYLSPALDTENVGWKFYDRADPEPRTPFLEGSFDLGSPGSTIGLPEEVAVCLSFRGVLASGSPPARRRGRVYLGPLNTDVLSYSNRTLVDQAFIDDTLAAYEAAWAELTLAGLAHAVWSPTDGVSRPVVQAWMDTAFDTQRRRGPLPTSRTVIDGPW